MGTNRTRLRMLGRLIGSMGAETDDTRLSKEERKWARQSTLL